jgi:DHA1 family inner membrane transport protein
MAKTTKVTTLALALSSASTGPQILALSLLMPDISKALNVSVPVLGQLNTAFSVVSIFTSFMVSILTTRFTPKKLLYVGIIALFTGLITSTIADGYLIMAIGFLIYGVGFGLVLPVTNLMVALYPINERTSTMGWVFSGRSIISIVATPITGILAESYGWRLGYIGFGLPLILLSLILVSFNVPDGEKDEASESLVKGIHKVFTVKSAVACIAGASLALVFFSALMVFNGSYLRDEMGLSISQASLVMSVTFLAIAIGQVASGVAVSHLGLRRATYLTIMIGGLSLMTYFTFRLHLAFSLASSIIGAAMGGTTMTTMSALALDQVREQRGTMMGLNSAAFSVANMIGSGIGGFTLDLAGYPSMGATLFIISVISSLTYFLWAREPALEL